MPENTIKKALILWMPVPVVCIALQFTAAAFGAGSGNNPQDARPLSISSIPLTPQVLGATTTFRGQESEEPQVPAFTKIKEPDAAGLSAKSVLAYDLASGTVLAEKNTAGKMSIASLTKLLTALVVYEQVSLTDTVSIPAKNITEVSPVLRLQPEDQVQVSDLFNAMLIGSGNDAAQILAGHVEKSTGKNFVSLMNEKAHELGMENSKFSNPYGFDSRNNYSTALDLKKLVDATQKLAAFVNLGKKTSYDFISNLGNKYHIGATNKLVSKHADIEAVKTGYTESSQGSMITKTTKNGNTIVFILLGSNNREKDTINLMDEVVQSYEWK